MKSVLRYVVVASAAAVFFSTASAIDFNVFVPGDTIRAAEMNENFSNIEAALEQDKTLMFPAWALSHSIGGTTVTDTNTGLLWEASFSGGATLVIPRPGDWDGASPVTLDLYFYPQTSAAGSVNFFLRPRSFEVGEAWSDASSMDGTPVATAGLSVLAKQSISIPASRFGDGELWYITMQRGGTGETYPDPIILLSVALTYTPGH